MPKKQTYNELRLKDQLAPTQWRMYLLICIVGLMITGIMGYGFFKGGRMSKVYAPLVDIAMEIKLEATTAHLWFEEIISGDRHEDISEVWKHQDQAEWYAKAMLEGGKNQEGSGRGTKKDYLRFLYISLASLKETEYFLLLSYDLGYLHRPDYIELTELVNSTFAPLHGLMKSVKKDTGIIGGLMALIVSGIIIGLARHYQGA